MGEVLGSLPVGPPAESTWPRTRSGEWSLEGSAESLASLHRRYRTRLEAVAYRILGNHADAEDVVQRIFLKLPRTRFRGDSSIWTYLYRASVNASVNTLRSRRRRERLQQDLALAAAPTEAAPVSAAPAPSPEGRVLEGEILAGVARALLAVKPRHRRVLVLRIVWGLSNVEIARREGIPVATVGTWLRRGRAELAREMGPMLSELEEGAR